MCPALTKWQSASEKRLPPQKLTSDVQNVIINVKLLIIIDRRTLCGTCRLYPLCVIAHACGGKGELTQQVCLGGCCWSCSGKCWDLEKRKNKKLRFSLFKNDLLCILLLQLVSINDQSNWWRMKNIIIWCKSSLLHLHFARKVFLMSHYPCTAISCNGSCSHHCLVKHIVITPLKLEEKKKAYKDEEVFKIVN